MFTRSTRSGDKAPHPYYTGWGAALLYHVLMPGNGIEDAAYVLAIKLARGDFGGTGGNTTPPTGGGGGDTPVSILPTQAPTAVTDAVKLTKVTGVTWTVGGTDYPSSAFALSTRTVNVSSPGSVTVTAKADTGYVLSGTTSWTLVFTAVNINDGKYLTGLRTRVTGTYGEYVVPASAARDMVIIQNTGTGNLKVAHGTGDDMSIPSTGWETVPPGSEWYWDGVKTSQISIQAEAGSATALIYDRQKAF